MGTSSPSYTSRNHPIYLLFFLVAGWICWPTPEDRWWGDTNPHSSWWWRSLDSHHLGVIHSESIPAPPTNYSSNPREKTIYCMVPVVASPGGSISPPRSCYDRRQWMRPCNSNIQQLKACPPTNQWLVGWVSHPIPSIASFHHSGHPSVPKPSSSWSHSPWSGPSTSTSGSFHSRSNPSSPSTSTPPPVVGFVSSWVHLMPPSGWHWLYRGPPLEVGWLYTHDGSWILRWPIYRDLQQPN